MLTRIPDGNRVLMDGLALGGLPREVNVHGRRLRLVALVHHPLADESGLPGHLRSRFQATEREALRACRGVVVTSSFTRERVRGLGFPPERIRVAPPGTAPASPSSAPTRAPAFGEDAAAPPHLLCVGSVSPRKGQDVLIEAMTHLGEYSWNLTLAGSPFRDPTFARALEARILDAGLQERIRMVGEVDDEELERLYGESSLLVVPSRYEGYGMVVTEALARGIPVVSTDGGALRHTVPSGAGVVVPAGDPVGLARTLARLLRSRQSAEAEEGSGEWRRLADEARRQSQRLPDWPSAALTLADAMESLAGLPPDHLAPPPDPIPE